MVTAAVLLVVALALWALFSVPPDPGDYLTDEEWEEIEAERNRNYPIHLN